MHPELVIIENIEEDLIKTMILAKPLSPDKIILAVGFMYDTIFQFKNQIDYYYLKHINLHVPLNYDNLIKNGFLERK